MRMKVRGRKADKRGKEGNKRETGRRKMRGINGREREGIDK